MAHPEVVSRVQRAQRVAGGLAALTGAVGLGEGLVGGLAHTATSHVLPGRAAPVLVTLQCGGAAASAGPVRAGDVEFARQMVGPLALGGSPGEIAYSLTRSSDDLRHQDLSGLIHAVQLVPGLHDPTRTDLDADLRALVAEFRGPWCDPVLNAPVDPVPFASSASSTLRPRALLAAVKRPSVAVVFIALVVFAFLALH